MDGSMNLDKGLDEIITAPKLSNGGSRAPRARKPRGHGSPKTLGKALAASKAAKQTTATKAVSKASRGKKNGAASSGSAALAALAALNPLTQAKRAVVTGMPLDVDEPTVAKFFSEQVGKVRKVQASYRENGRPTGTYTIQFEKPGAAQRLFEKFNNEPVDGGKSRMTVQLLVEAPKPAPTLEGRIGAGAKKDAKPDPKKRQGGRGEAKKAAPLKKAVEPVKATKTKAKPKAKKAPKRAQPTSAQLDADMVDYFANAPTAAASTDAEISV